MAVVNRASEEVIQQLEADLGLTDDDLARALGIHPRSIQRWRAGETQPQREARERLATLDALRAHLHETFTPPGARSWLHEPNRFLGWLSPADAIRVGRFDRVEAALEAIDSGIFI